VLLEKLACGGVEQLVWNVLGLRGFFFVLLRVCLLAIFGFLRSLKDHFQEAVIRNLSLVLGAARTHDARFRFLFDHIVDVATLDLLLRLDNCGNARLFKEAEANLKVFQLSLKLSQKLLVGQNRVILVERVLILLCLNLGNILL
jgi:hypothetical protein